MYGLARRAAGQHHGPLCQRGRLGLMAPRQRKIMRRQRRAIHGALHEHQIQPAPELAPHLRHPARLDEAQPLVQSQRPGIGRIDGAHHHMHLARAGLIEQRLDQRRTQPPAPLVGPHMHTVLDRMPVARPVAPKRPESGIAEDGSLTLRPLRLFGHQHRIPRGHPGLEPRRAFGQIHRRPGIDRRRRGDQLIENGQNGRQIPVTGCPDPERCCHDWCGHGQRARSPRGVTPTMNAPAWHSYSVVLRYSRRL